MPAAAPVPDAWLAAAIAIARGASAILKDGFGGPSRIEMKGAIDLVTEHDRASEAYILGEIARRFPGHAVLAEESGGSAADPAAPPPYRWIADPLDGTTNFAHGLPFFCVSLALEADGERALGVLYDPLRDECFAARKGGGATLNGVPIRVSTATSLASALGCTGFPYDVMEKPEETLRFFAPLLPTMRGVRRLGSAALDLGYVACGRLDLFWEVKLHPWDVAAGILIVEEAGGRVTDFVGTPVAPEPIEIAATNGALHEPFLAELRKIERLRG
ncbi:MAG: inositol monophosphatase family protein [Candidatus Eisenbacteria bacterium]